MSVQFDKLLRHEPASGSNKLYSQGISLTRDAVPAEDKALEKFIVYDLWGEINVAASVIKALQARS